MKHISENPFMRLNLQQFAEGEDSGDAGSAASAEEAGTPAENGENGTKQAGEDNSKVNDTTESLKAEIARLTAEMAKQKNALDNATKEAGDYRKQLKARMTQEEIDATAKKEAEEKAAQELDELRKKVARAENTKAVMSKLSVDEDTAGQIAESLHGCENIENVLLLIQKEWQKKEKQIRIEFGKVTPPGAGADSNSPEAQAIERAKGIGKDRAASAEKANKAIAAYLR